MILRKITHCVSMQNNNEYLFYVRNDMTSCILISGGSFKRNYCGHFRVYTDYAVKHLFDSTALRIISQCKRQTSERHHHQ
jgi:hypothetical protein